MKRAFYSVLLFTGICTAFIACNNGDYKVNPAAGNVVNPLNPLTKSQFTWSGTDPLSCTVNGGAFVADSSFTYCTVDSLNGNSIIGLKSGSHGISLYLRNVYAGNVYNMSYGGYNIMATWVDSLGGPSDGYYESALGNSGEVYIVENDSAYIKGYFYFEGVSDSGTIVSVKNGYFHVKKS